MAQPNKIAKTFDVTGLTSIQNVLTASHTDWDPRVLPAGGDAFANGGHMAIIRPDTNTMVAAVGNRFTPNNHRNQLYTLDKLVSSGILEPVNVAVWDNGALMAFQFRCPDLAINVNGRDMVNTILTKLYSYGVKVKDRCFFGGNRAFCKNQMGAFAKADESDGIGHRGNTEARYAELLQDRIHQLTGDMATRRDSFQRMSEKELRGKKVLEFYADALGLDAEQKTAVLTLRPSDLKGPEAKVSEVIEAYLEDDCGAEGTVWQAYNGLTRYLTHNAGRKPETRLKSMLTGDGNKIAQTAYRMAVQAAA